LELLCAKKLHTNGLRHQPSIWNLEFEWRPILELRSRTFD
jgi:hypothetical protein